MRQKLTERTLSRKAEGEVWDEYLPGFGLRIGKRKRTYFVMGRVGGRQVRRTVGTTVDLNLAEAREKARGMLADLARGVDPVDAEKRERAEAARQQRTTFAGVAADYMFELGRHRKDAAERQRMLDVDINPRIGEIPIRTLARSDIKGLILDKAALAPVMAARLKSLIHTILNYSLDEELVDSNVAARIRLPSVRPRDRYLAEDEIRRFWNGLEFTRLDPQLSRILKLLLLLGQRRTEVGHIRWSELDLERGVWELPAERTKSGRAHRVPLSPLALDLIGEPDGHEHVFHHRDGSPFGRFSISHAMRRELPALGLADKPATPHDLRRTAASQMAELGIDRLTISKILNHADPTITGAIYELSEHWEKKRLAMRAWADKLQEIATGKARPSNVEPLVRAVQ